MKKRSLNFKLLAGGSLCVLVPLLVFAILSDIQLSRSMKETNEQNTINVAKSLSGLTQLVLQQVIELAKDLAVGNTTIDVAAKVTEAGIEDSTEAIQRLERKLVNTMKQIGENYEVILVCNPEGVVYADSLGGSWKGISIQDRQYFQDAKINKINLSTPVKSKNTGKPVMPICIPIFSPSGELTGALTVVLKIDFLSEKFLSVKLGKSGYAFMANQSGIVIIHPNPKHILELDMKTLKGMESITDKMLAQKTGVENYSFEGIEKIAVFAPVDLTGWSVCVNQPMEELMSSVISLRKNMVLVSAFLLCITLISIWFFSRSVTKPINQIIETLNESAEQVTSAASQVSSASQALAEGSSQQAASVEETSSTLEEMSSMTQQNASNAGQANSLMKQSSQVVSKANTSMSQLTTSMKEISIASEETSKIIKTIDEIAFQTNLLALNAAVEAARAGEAGAGFAVVADEVRNLAMRAADAARSTAALIEGTIKKVTDGTELVKITNDNFKGVASSTQKVSELVGEITAASNEQAQGIEQVNIAVSEMDKVTQQNAATAEESASASEQMNAQAEQMKGMVNDLVAIVSGNAVVSPSGFHTANSPRPAMHAGHAPPKKIKINKTQSKGKSLQFQQVKKIHPNDIIPVDENDFKDF